eukprot:s249_g1.t1
MVGYLEFRYLEFAQHSAEIPTFACAKDVAAAVELVLVPKCLQSWFGSELQPCPEAYLQNLQATRNVYLHLSFDRAKPSRAFCGIYAPALSEAWVCFSGGAESKQQELENYLSELFAKGPMGHDGDVVRIEVSFQREKRLDALVLWAEQRLQEIRKHDGGCICILSSQLSSVELRGLAPSCYLQQKSLRNVTALREIPLCQAPFKQSKFVLDWQRSLSKYFASVGGQGSQHPPVLKSAAEAVARSLVRTVKGEHGTLEVSRQLQQLKDVLLAEHPDASAGAKNRCNALRSGFAHALKTALSQTPEGQKLLEGPKTLQKARVEVRHTAARLMLSEVFTVGRAAECDVQTTGDATTSRLQFLVISLPQGLCIADAWSGGGTRVVRRERGELVASVPQHRAIFVLPHGERVTLMTGAKTTVTLGPAVKDLKKEVNGVGVNGMATVPPRVPTMRLMEEAKTPVPKAVPAPAPSAGPNGSAPAGANGAATVTVAAPSSPGSCAYLCSRAIASLRSNMRAQQQQALKERLKGRLLAAQRQKLIAKQQLMVFQERLEDPGGTDGASVEDLRDFLDGLGVAPAPDDPCTSNWTCTICKVSQKLGCINTTSRWKCKGFRCPFRHRACRDCFLKQVDSKCPSQSCGYILGAADMQDLRFPEERCKVFTPTAKVQDIATPCRAGCGAAFSAQAKRQAWSCSCGAAPVCTACGVWLGCISWCWMTHAVALSRHGGEAGVFGMFERKPAWRVYVVS